MRSNKVTSTVVCEMVRREIDHIVYSIVCVCVRLSAFDEWFLHKEAGLINLLGAHSCFGRSVNCATYLKSLTKMN